MDPRTDSGEGGIRNDELSQTTELLLGKHFPGDLNSQLPVARRLTDNDPGGL